MSTNTGRWNEKIKNANIGTRAILIIYSIIVLYPMFWTVLFSLKSNKEFFTNIYGFPEKLQFINYVNAWNKANMAQYFQNSMIYTIFSLILIVILSSTTSYCLARCKFRLNKFLTMAYVAGLMIPTMAGIIPLFIQLKSFNMLNNRAALILIYAVYALPFSIFLLISFFKTINTEIEEAAFIDGCNLYKLFYKIMFPLAKPGIIALIVIEFLYVWNEFTFAYVLISSNKKRNLQVALANLNVTQYQRTDWAVLFAAIVIVTLPTVIVYVLFQRRIIQNITLGAIK